ncbi:MAG: hypothetical protein ACI4PE_03540 [Bacilli bacterium]
MKKKVLKIIGIIFVVILYTIITNVIIIEHVMYKDNLENNHLEQYNNMIENIVLKENVDITHKIANEYVTFNELKIRNDFKDFTKEIDEENPTRVVYKFEDINNKQLVTFEIDTYEETINASYSSEFIEKYNIKNDIDYINVLKNYDFEKTRFNYKKLSENGDATVGAESYSSKETHYNIITGDYTGLIKTEEYSLKKIVYLYQNNKTYELTFNGFGYFTDEQIYDLISTIIIE